MNIDRLSEENLRIDWNVECEQAQFIATLGITLSHCITHRRKFSAVSVLLSSKWKERKEDIVVGSEIP